MSVRTNCNLRKAPLARALTLALLAPVTMIPTLALAQSAATKATETASQSSVERIQIRGSRLDKASTATGLPLSLRQTPQSVSIIDQEFIDSFALESVADVMMFAPGIQAQQAETDRYFFRARGNDITNFQFDGVPVNYDSFFNDAVSDTIMFERVEIVRGATGLLTGAGEPSAAINLIRKRPKAESGGYVSAQVGSWDHRRLEADHSADVTDDGRVKVRFAAAYEEGESYIDLAEKENLQLYGVLTADVTDQTQLTFGIDHNQRDPKGSTWGALPLFYADGSLADDLSRSTTTAAEWSKWEREGTNVFAGVKHAFDNRWDLNVEIERREDEMDGHLLYLSGFPDRETGLGMNAFPMIYQSERKQNALRAMASGPYELLGREHQLTTGLLYSEQDIVADSFYTTDVLTVGNFLEWDGSIAEPSYPAVPLTDAGTETQKGFYAATQLNVHDQVTLILGNRFSQYELDSTLDRYEHDSVNTPYAGIVVDVSDVVSVYTSYTEIFLPQNARDVNNRRLDPVEGTNVEAGVKGDFLNEALTASFAVFQVEKDNVAEPDPDFTTPLPDGSFPQRAVKGTSNKGYELELTGQPNEAVDLYFSYTHSESERADGSAFNTFLPDNMLRASALYRISDPITVGANVNWQSSISQPGIGPNGETAEQDAYTLVNLMARYQLSENLETRLNIRNLFDTKYYSSIDFFNQGFLGAPRSVQLSLSYSW